VFLRYRIKTDYQTAFWHGLFAATEEDIYMYTKVLCSKIGRRWSRVFVSSLGFCLLLVSPLIARIGDTPELLASRILQPNLGRYFSWPKEMDEQARERAIKDNPLHAFVYLLPPSGDDWREQIFWKSALRKQFSNSNGWRIHAYYLKGRSVVECYRRVGEELNEFEVNAILVRMRGEDTWQKVGAEQKVATIIGYDYELGALGSESLRARRQGDWLIVYHKRFDDFLLERKDRWDANEAVRKSEEKAQNEKLAPVSVEGI
jgi:hypothetical protein